MAERTTMRSIMTTRGGDTTDASAIRKLRRLGGWSEAEALGALEASGGDIAVANEALGSAEDEAVGAHREAGLSTLTSEGFDARDAERALRETCNDAGAARAVLARDAEEMSQQLDEATATMVANGWPEDEARARLLEDYEARKRGEDPTTVNVATETPMAAPQSVGIEGSAPQPVNMSDVYFNVTLKDYQKRVIDSTVPVIVDVHAEWCQPCKALAPILEQVGVMICRERERCAHACVFEALVIS